MHEPGLRQIFMSLPPQERYVYKPFLGSSHTWALNLVSKEPITSSLLDIGSGSGAIGAELKSRGFEQLYAVETDPGARAHAGTIYTEAHDSLSAYNAKKFDIILLLDVLEHTSEPAELLKAALSLLNPGGLLLISVPNIAHWSVRGMLLFGIFDYQERGILDKTHLRFFTRKSLKQLFNLFPELEVVGLAGSITPLELLFPKWACNNPFFSAFSRLRMFLTEILPGLFSYQQLAGLRRKA